ncbi:hypothetical protein BDW62DRAFT_3309 [Aspergillus aurantiobrunneus]
MCCVDSDVCLNNGICKVSSDTNNPYYWRNTCSQSLWPEGCLRVCAVRTPSTPECFVDTGWRPRTHSLRRNRLLANMVLRQFDRMLRIGQRGNYVHGLVIFQNRWLPPVNESAMPSAVFFFRLRLPLPLSFFHLLPSLLSTPFHVLYSPLESTRFFS